VYRKVHEPGSALRLNSREDEMQNDSPRMKTVLGFQETLVCSGPENAQCGMETVGGWLYLTSERLIFEAHRFDIQRGPTIIPIHQISGLERCWTRFLGVVPLAPSSILVRTLEGEAYQFVVCGRGSWLADMGDQIAAHDGRSGEDEGTDLILGTSSRHAERVGRRAR